MTPAVPSRWDPRAVRQQRSAWRRYPSVTVHAALIAVIVLLLTWAELTHHVEGDANIGAGIVVLLLAACGLPWSFYVLQAPRWMNELPLWQADVVWALPAVLNVLLHLGIVFAYNQRQRARP